LNQKEISPPFGDERKIIKLVVTIVK